MFGFSAAALADKTFTCTKGSSVREVVLAYETQGASLPCRVLYKKDGTEQSLWQAQNTEGYCEEKADEFIKNLSEMGWHCAEQSANSDEVNEVSDTDQ